MFGSATAATVEVPGATLHYELHGDGPLLALHAAPMDATSFAPLVERLASDHTVLVSDPRGINRSTVDDRRRDVTPDERADDLARLLEHVDRGPAMAFGSSGGAVSALSLAGRRPDLVPTVVAHEPPLAALLPDRDELVVAHEAMVETYRAGDRLGYWRSFMRTAGIDMPEEVLAGVFGGPIEGREAADEAFAVEHMDMPTTFWAPDLAALRRSGVRVVVGIGEDSAGQLCDRAARALAAALDAEPALFPGGHLGFVDEPDGFARCLLAVLGEG